LAYAWAYAILEVMPQPHTSRHVRLFRNGRNQAIRIPREFELPGEEAILRRESSGRLILEPVRPMNLRQILDSWTPLEEKDSFPEIEDAFPEAVNL
jgi:antitoxin VapB